MDLSRSASLDDIDEVDLVINGEHLGEVDGFGWQDDGKRLNFVVCHVCFVGKDFIVEFDSHFLIVLHSLNGVRVDGISGNNSHIASGQVNSFSNNSCFLKNEFKVVEFGLQFFNIVRAENNLSGRSSGLFDVGLNYFFLDFFGGNGFDGFLFLVVKSHDFLLLSLHLHHCHVF